MPNMQEIELFDSHGAMRPLDEIAGQLANADDATRARFEAVKVAYDECAGIEGAIKFSTDRAVSIVSEIREAENLLRTHYAPQTREQAIRDFLATERIKRGVR